MLFVAFQLMPLPSIRGSWWLSDISPWFAGAMLFQVLYQDRGEEAFDTYETGVEKYDSFFVFLARWKSESTPLVSRTKRHEFCRACVSLFFSWPALSSARRRRLLPSTDPLSFPHPANGQRSSSSRRSNRPQHNLLQILIFRVANYVATSSIRVS